MYLLAKFGKEKYLKSFQKGKLFFNNISLFQKPEDLNPRNDNLEGTTLIQNYHMYDNLKVTMDFRDGTKIPINPSFLQARESHKESRFLINSLYAFKSPEIFEENHTVDKRMAEFGDHFLIIWQVQEFFDRLLIEFRKQDVFFQMKLVNYYNDREHNGELSPFHKPEKFNFQREYRILFEAEDSKPKTLDIGNLESISEIKPIEFLNELHITAPK